MRKRSLIFTTTVLLSISSSRSICQVVTHGIKESNKALEKRIDQVIQAIPAKSVVYKKKADAVKLRSDELTLFINNLSERIVKKSGGRDNEGNIIHMDNIEAATTVLANENEGDRLKNKIIALRRFLLSEVTNPGSLVTIIPLKIEDAPVNGQNAAGNWIQENFGHVPVVAVVALFEKLQNDLRDSELIVLNKILEESLDVKNGSNGQR